MKIYPIYGRGIASNSYLICDDEMTASAIADPAITPDMLQAQMPNLPMPSSVLLTHGHFDHITALSAYTEIGTPVYIHSSDADMLSDGFKNASLFFFDAPTVVNNAKICTVAHGQKIKIGNECLTVMHTPGHTAGSVCYIADTFTLTGDTVFADGGRGRTDLYSGSETDIQKSIDRILTLDGKTPLYSGHGPKTTVNDEKRYY